MLTGKIAHGHTFGTLFKCGIFLRVSVVSVRMCEALEATRYYYVCVFLAVFLLKSSENVLFWKIVFEAVQ